MVDISIIALSSLLFAFATWLHPAPKKGEQVEYRGMVVEWKFTEEHLEVSMKSPRKGWVAVGFNESSELTGTNLVMAAVRNGKAVLEDQTILAPGSHPSIKSLGVAPAVRLLAAEENEEGTRIVFSLPRRPLTEYHKALNPGRQIHLLLAYSMEDDFAHHSIARTSFLIEL